jgi:hypothetical protein
MQLVLAAESDSAMIASDGFSDLIGKRALRRRRRSLQKAATGLDKDVEDGKATDVDSGHGTGSTNDRAETGEVREGDTPSSPPKQGNGRRHQRRATWAEVVAAGGDSIPAVFNLLGLSLDKAGKGGHRSRNRGWPGTPKTGASKEAPPCEGTGS